MVKTKKIQLKTGLLVPMRRLELPRA